MITDIFLNQKRVNVFEHTVKMAPHERVFERYHQGVAKQEGGSEGKIKWKLSEVNTRAVSRGQNELIGEFKMAAGNVISIRE